MKNIFLATLLALAAPALGQTPSKATPPKPTTAKGSVGKAGLTKVKVKIKTGPVVVPVPPATEMSPPATAASAVPAMDNGGWNEEYGKLITEKQLNQHLSVLASDEYEGRETGEKGQHMAAAYVAAQFEAAGLSGPLLKTTTPYLQKFKLQHSVWAPNPTLKIGEVSYRWLVDFYGRGDANFAQETVLQPVFVGYGIDEAGYNDYADLNVNGKDLLMLEGEPLATDGTPLLGATGQPSRWADDTRAKLTLATAKGARSVFFVNFNPRSNFAKLAARLGPSIAKSGIVMAGEKPDRVPAFYISPAVGYKLMGTNEKALLAYQAQLAAAHKPVAARFKPGKLRLKAAKILTPFDTENAVGVVEGSDKKSEVLVVSAHHDHLGIIDGKVYNGADDDGSGTSSIIAIAEAFARAKAEGHGPRRSILFLSVTGEEEGLYGSEYYANHPIFPLASTVADLNVDMVGRTDPDHEGKPDYVYVIGSDKLASQLKVTLEEQNARYEHLDLDYKFDDPSDPNRFYYRSDHYNFAVKKIPVAFFFNGVHDDYHQETDEIGKIQFDKMAKRARLVFHTAWELANREERLVVDSSKE